ncbi:MAG: 16S rRNA (cytidine(1402)-2'-O)-methyltransferase [Deltaproteobacteria bacterium]|nr:16S rRNA (cytidine(1402)-2'-O)-methyltransferase [Deltaproteobacteria bacterium]
MSDAAQAKLQVVATPIGNVGDLSSRAVEALKLAAVVCAEDTRHTRPLLDRVGASGARLLSVHAHNERERAPEVVALLQQGTRVCFVSDAGCPGVSDPGGRLVEAVAAAGVEVEVLPGPSALTAALMGAGVDVARFAFLGFLPRKGKERETLVKAATDAGLGVVLYEAANRTDDLLVDLHAWCGPRRVVVARELTKLHETFHRGALAKQGAAALSPPFVDRGEVVVVVEAGAASAAPAHVPLDVARLAADPTLSPKDKARRLAEAQGIPVREAYARLQAAQDGSGAGEVKRALQQAADAAMALLAADDRARAARGLPDDDSPAAGSDVTGADAALRLLARPSALAAPVEGHAAAKALLAALAALDDLREALVDGGRDAGDDADDDDESS